MNRNKDDERFDRDLDRAIRDIRDESVDPAVIDAAGRRVWSRLERHAGGAPTGAIRTCSDFQGLFPAYLDGKLPEARTLLLEDHVRECVRCRRALHAARSTPPRAARPALAARHGAWRSPWTWALAAVVLAAAVLAVVRLHGLESGAPIRVASVSGALYELSGDVVRPVSPGARFANGETVRTAKDSDAVIELEDGSRVEMDQRSELRVTRRGKDATIGLARGNVIVQASDQGSGHLYVRTDDCLVSVTGTVFSVVHGNRGSRISVIEGEVHVDDQRGREVLHPGDQISTDPRLAPVPIAQEIGWSRNLDQHLALLKELSALKRELHERIPDPGLRYSTRLLDLAPEGTVVYLALPNLSETLDQAYRLLQHKVETSPALGAWWRETMVASGGDRKLEDAMREIVRFGGQLGDEIVVTLQNGDDGRGDGPVFLAELEQPDEFRRLVRDKLAARSAGEAEQLPMRIVEDPSKLTGHAAELLFWPHGNILVAAMRPADLQRAAGGGGFAHSAFHDRLADDYHEGVEILFGADLESIVGHGASADATASLSQLGLSDLRHLIVERHEEGDRTRTRAALTFDQARRGLASWLAEPGPLGSLRFISADASAAAAFVVRTPASLLAELFDAIGSHDGGFKTALEQFQRDHGVDLVQDVAGPLGGEVAFALDGPVLPQPAWKLVMEVYDQNGLQQAVEWAVEQVNEAARREGRGGLSLTVESVAGRTYHRVTSQDAGLSLVYTFVDGYVVVAPQRALIDRAIRYRESGYALPDSERFKDLLPRDGQAYFSAIVYHDLGPIIDPLLRNTLARSAPLTPEQRAAVKELSHDAAPSLFYAYAAPQRIVVGGSDRAGLFGSDLWSGLSLGSILSMQAELQHAAPGEDPDYDGSGSDGR